MEHNGILLQIILLLHSVGAVILIYRLWFKQEAVLKKIFWTFVIIIPVIGPVLYLAFFKVPSVLPIHRQNRDRAGSHGTGNQHNFYPQKIIDFFTTGHTKKDK